MIGCLKQVKVPSAIGIDPKLSRGAAPIPLPRGQVLRLPPQHHAALGPVCYRACRPPRQRVHLPAVQIDGVQERGLGKRQLGVDRCDRAAQRREARHRHHPARERHPMHRSPTGRHPVQVRLPFFPAHKHQARAVRREARTGKRPHPCRQAARRAPRGRHGPQVVLGHERHLVPVNGWIAHISQLFAKLVHDVSLPSLKHPRTFAARRRIPAEKGPRQDLCPSRHEPRCPHAAHPLGVSALVMLSPWIHGDIMSHGCAEWPINTEYASS